MRARASRGGWLDTDDLRRRFGCSPATLYRCIYERGLKPSRTVGREMFFAGRHVEAWVKTWGVPGRKGKGGEAS